eukprot:TRINITY_DN1813_c0_g1_i6.p1 TRINITY_DN1813_c0_g1~~TRINITY_DN1813_c0_g1_i6.p1  ORF type:complete len:400 (+),score=51.43 TRINITY_DN1813_c0_g1_i6:95-1294(+)
MGKLVRAKNIMQDHKVHYTPEQIRKLKCEGWRVLIGGILLHMILGVFYLWGGISVYVASYFRQYDDSITIKMMAGVFPYMNIACNSSLSFGVKLAERFGHKLVMLVGMCIICSCVFAASFVTNFYLFVFVYAVLIGVTSGVIYMLPVQCGFKYFPNNKGRVSGLIVAGYGFGAFIFNFVAKYVANPDGLLPDLLVKEPDGTSHKYFKDEVASRVPMMFRVIALCYAVLAFIGLILVKFPKDLHLELVDEHEVITKEGQTKAHEVAHECETVSQGLKSRPLRFLLPMTITAPFWGMLIANSYKLYGFYLGKNDAFLTLVGSLHSVFNGCSRPFWGIMLDCFGFRKVFFVIVTAQIAIIATITLIVDWDILYLLWICFTMFLEGGQLAIFPAVTTKVFGHK